MKPFFLEDDVAVVTGAARGIGRAIALELASNGADIAVVDVLAEEAAKVVKEVEALGRRGQAYTVDISDGEAVKKLVDDAAPVLYGVIRSLISTALFLISIPIIFITNYGFLCWPLILLIQLTWKRIYFRIQKKR